MTTLAPLLPTKRFQSMRELVPTVDQVMIEERAASFTKRSIKTTAKLAGLKMAVSMMDLTTLEGKDTPGKMAYLCRKALQPIEAKYEVPCCGAVCVYPNMVKYARKFLGENSPVHVASVATGFPSGQVPLRVKLEETRRAAGDGADEIDMVIDRGAFLSGDFGKVFDEVAAIKSACGAAHLKVILETGALADPARIVEASLLAIDAGADFIKTSTGKLQPGATLAAARAMLTVIRETKRPVGFKAAGGVRTLEQALDYVGLAEEIMGPGWCTPATFRIGASGLLDDLLRHLGDGTIKAGAATY